MIYTVTLTPALDKSYTIDDFSAGKVNRVLESRSDPGGKGINVSKTICALGGRSVAMGIVGGQTGRLILDGLDALGIEHDFIQSGVETRTNIKISDPVNHTTTDINERGNYSDIECKALFDRLEERLVPGDIVALAGRMDAGKCDVAEIVRRIQAAGAKLCLDTEGEALTLGAGASPWMIKPNETEFVQLTGMNAGEDLNGLGSAALRIAEQKGIALIVLSLGEKGALFVADKEVYYAAALSVTPVSTVGAGDAMCAALCYGLDVGLSLRETYCLAVACASAAVECPGSKSPERGWIERLLPQVEIRRLL